MLFIKKQKSDSQKAWVRRRRTIRAMIVKPCHTWHNQEDRDICTIPGLFHVWPVPVCAGFWCRVMLTAVSVPARLTAASVPALPAAASVPRSSSRSFLCRKAKFWFVRLSINQAWFLTCINPPDGRRAIFELFVLKNISFFLFHNNVFYFYIIY